MGGGSGEQSAGTTGDRTDVASCFETDAVTRLGKSLTFQLNPCEDMTAEAQNVWLHVRAMSPPLRKPPSVSRNAANRHHDAYQTKVRVDVSSNRIKDWVNRG